MFPFLSEINGQNLALNRPVEVSTIQSSYSPSNAVDGNPNTRWVSQAGEPQHIIVNLEELFEVNQVGFTSFNFTGGYTIDVWDGTDWINQITVSGNTNETASHTISPVFTYRVRLTVTNGGTFNNRARIRELEVYGTGNSQGPAPSPPPLQVGRIEAEDFSDSFNVTLDICGDQGGGQDVKMNQGSWIDFDVEILNDASYSLEIRKNDFNDVVNLSVSVNSSLVHTISTNNSGWHSYSLPANILLTAGINTIRIERLNNGINDINWIEITEVIPPPPPPIAESALIPEKIEAENFNNAVAGTQSTTDLEGVSDVVLGNSGWVEYFINVESPGLFEIATRVGGNSWILFDLLVDNAISNSIDWVATNNSWNTPSTIIKLTEGTHTLKIQNTGNQFRLNWIDIKEYNSTLPLKMQSEHYSSMAGIRTEICQDTDGGANVGWIEAGDFMNYEVDVPQSGEYTVNFRIAGFNNINTQFELKNGPDVLATINHPPTGSFQAWTTVTDQIYLEAGPQILTVNSLNRSWNFNWMEFILETPGPPGSPLVSTNTCGPKTFTRSNPPSHEVWYWQTTAEGTSTLDSNPTYQVHSNQTVYLRSLKNNQYWGPSTPIDVTILDLPAIPTIQPIAYSYEEVTVIRDDPTSTEGWYWQSSATGTDTTDTSGTQTMTSPETLYLRSKGSNGCWSDALSIVLSAQEPTAVTTTPVSEESIRISWSGGVGNETGFRISRSEGVNEMFVPIYDALGSDREYTDTGLSASTTYSYRIQAMVGGELSTAMQVMTVSTTIDENLSQTGLYNGNISAIRWKGVNDEAEQVFAYSYDGLNRLRSAQYAAKTGTTYTANQGHYSVPNISYDLNGNITALTRQGLNADNSEDIIDELAYDYGVGATQSNQLLSVSDGRGSAGFKDGNQTGDDYAYDANGNLIQDLNKDITGITYNHLNLPEEVTFQNGDRIEYFYDAAGIKLQQKVYEGGVLKKTTDYVGEYIYETGESGERKLQLIQHEEGRIVQKEQPPIQPAHATVFASDFSTVPAQLTLISPSSDVSFGQLSINDEVSPNVSIGGSSLPPVVHNGFVEFTFTTEVGKQYFLHYNFPAAIVPIYANQIALQVMVDGQLVQTHGFGTGPAETSFLATGTQTVVRFENQFNTDPLDPTAPREEVNFVLDDFRLEVVSDPVEQPPVFDYQYHLKDHLGNVRVTFSTTPENYMMVETFETGEDHGFQDLNRLTNSTANTTVGGDEVQLLQSGQTGAMIFLGMNQGDTIKLSVNANYEAAPSDNNFLGTAHSMLFNSFDGVYGSGIEDGIAATNTPFGDALSGANMAGKGDASTAPRAFLNFIFFDREMNYKAAGFAQISTAALGVGVHELVALDEPFIADQEGYILAYLSNENQETVNVHFDDFTVYHGKTNVVSTQDYYPFGLTFNGYQRTAITPQKYLYNGKELQEETGWLDYGARMYQPELGRWHAVDPASELYESHSIYNYVLNNPINYIDPNGMWVRGADAWNHLNEQLDSQGEKKSKQEDEYTGNVIVNVMESPTTDGSYSGTSWNSVDQNEMDGTYPKDGKMVKVNGFEAMWLYLSLYKSVAQKLNNLVIMGHGNVSDFYGDGYYDYGAIVGNGVLTSSRLNLNTNEGILMSRVAKLVNDDGNILFTACYAGWTHKEMKSLMESSGVSSINIFMNKDFSSAKGIGRKVNFENGSITYDSYHLELNTWLTKNKNYKYGWINAMNGRVFSNVKVSSGGAIIPE